MTLDKSNKQIQATIETDIQYRDSVGEKWEGRRREGEHTHSRERKLSTDEKDVEQLR